MRENKNNSDCGIVAIANALGVSYSQARRLASVYYRGRDGMYISDIVRIIGEHRFTRLVGNDRKDWDAADTGELVPSLGVKGRVRIVVIVERQDPERRKKKLWGHIVTLVGTEVVGSFGNNHKKGRVQEVWDVLTRDPDPAQEIPATDL